MPQTYVVSDWHLNHRNILTYCPHRRDLFGDVDGMNNEILRQTLDRLGPQDTLYYLGDLTFQIGAKRADVLARLRPLADRVREMHWVVGNHDEPDRMPEVAALFASVTDAIQFRVGARMVYLSHYPLHVPHRDLLRLVSIHGHHHGTDDSPVGRIDVSIDSLYGLRKHFDTDYVCAPISIETALELADKSLDAPFASVGQPTN